MPDERQRFEVEESEDDGEELPCAGEFGAERGEQGTRRFHLLGSIADAC